MFTGLVEQMGTVDNLKVIDTGQRLSIKCQGWLELPEKGASISISGCCLTIVEAVQENSGIVLHFDVVEESLQCTTLGSLKSGDFVNLEQAMQLHTRVGGHFVQGHIDCVEHVMQDQDCVEGESRLRVGMQSIDIDTVVPKGSITIDGVSLTIAKVDSDWFEVALIPVTLQETTLGNLSNGDAVNIETDMVTRAVVQTVRRMHQN